MSSTSASTRAACAGSWCAQTLTDGFVPEHMVPALADGNGGLAERLVEAGLWRRVKGGCASHEWDAQAHIPADLRQRVYARDGYRCCECGATESLSLDHIYPWVLGGRETFENLRTLCGSCNSCKGARVPCP